MKEFKENFAAIWANWYYHDAVVFIVIVILAIIGYRLSQRVYWRVAFKQVFQRPMVVISFFVLCCYAIIALLDSIGYHHWMTNDKGEYRLTEQGDKIRDDVGQSVLDVVLKPLSDSKEKTYSAPFTLKQFTKQTFENHKGEVTRGYPILTGILNKEQIKLSKSPDWDGDPESLGVSMFKRHWLGTGKNGVDVLYMSLKGVRTGMIIGALTTIIVVPFAIFFGVVSGYFGGIVDDIIVYIYTVLASIPSVLLIIAFMMVAGRGLPQLCIIMGITSWTGLCRVLRGETMKLREMEFIQAGEAMGVSRTKIMSQHIVPNLMHIVLITVVLSFSGRVLAEAVLSYLSIGVGADTYSWGNMINDARLELARDPVILWKLGAAFIFMMGLVLPANLFGDALRDALDPRLRTQ